MNTWVGLDSSDKVLWRTNFNGDNCYRSAFLERLWPLGLCEIGDVTFQSAAYVARYIMVKRNGKMASDYYGSRLPEFTDMSRRPGIAALFIDKFMSDVYPHDFMVINGKRVRPPRYYDNRFELCYPLELEQLKDKRVRKARRFRSNNTKTRLLVREFISLDRASKLKRTL